MSERKVLNKYYPPDFDPSKIPRMKLAKNRQYTVRLMAPFNMRCATCGEYIYKGKKFNARKEDVENEDYLGIRIYRFYIKCTRCLQEISFKTDPKNTDYEIEAGATRNFMALKLAEEQAKKEEEEQKEEEANNPMKLLEYRTEQSKQEIELLESLEELKELNRRQRTVDYEGMLKQFQSETPEERKAREEKEDDEFIKSIKFSNPGAGKKVVEEIIEDVVDEDEGPPAKVTKTEIQPKSSEIKPPSWNRSIGVLSKKSTLVNLVKSKKANDSTKVKTDSKAVTETVVSTSVKDRVDNNNTTNVADATNETRATSATNDSNKLDQVASSDTTKGATVASNSDQNKVATGLLLLADYSGSDSDT